MILNPICNHTIINNNGVCKICQELKKVNTRDDARNYFIFHKMEYSNIGSKELYLLHKILTKNLKKFSPKINPHWIKMLPVETKINRLDFDNNGGIKYAHLRCQGDWFEEREAITFNKENFIGLCGWADDSNKAPFVESFVEWILILKSS